MVTLTVHSALDAVGFLAAITTRLAATGISVKLAFSMLPKAAVLQAIAAMQFNHPRL
jgi:hypothetical protein